MAKRGRARRAARRAACAHVGGRERDRQRAARAPEADALHGRAEAARAPNARGAGGQRQRVIDGGEHLDHAVEAADLEDLGDHGLHRRDGEARLARAHLLRRDHQNAQADAADVVDAGKIEHEDARAGHGSGHQWRQRRLELGSALMVNAAHGHGNDGIGDVARCDLQGASVLEEACRSAGRQPEVSIGRRPGVAKPSETALA